MSCPLCGDICRCSNRADSSAAPHWSADDPCQPAARVEKTPRAPEGEEPSLLREAEAGAGTLGNTVDDASLDAPAWRDEVAARLTRYQARRKPRPPRYPSLRLRFEEEASTRRPGDASFGIPDYMPGTGTVSRHALALDGFADDCLLPGTLDSASLALTDSKGQQMAACLPADECAQRSRPPKASASARIIEFPRSWTPPAAPLDELAEPVLDRPRILEAAEVAPPLPALGGITIEPAQNPELEKRPGIDYPLQSAPLARRIFAAAVDAIIISAACFLFGFIFWKMTAIRPARFQILGFTAALAGLCWAVYQYLLVVYSGSTPGLRLAKLRLARFDGSPVGRPLRRWRILASFLSAVSLGMGYAWVFLDEDALCWHDRITHTYLAPEEREEI